LCLQTLPRLPARETWPQARAFSVASRFSTVDRPAAPPAAILRGPQADHPRLRANFLRAVRAQSIPRAPPQAGTAAPALPAHPAHVPVLALDQALAALQASVHPVRVAWAARVQAPAALHLPAKRLGHSALPQGGPEDVKRNIPRPRKAR
jgi:hypothetical protein